MKTISYPRMMPSAAAFLVAAVFAVPACNDNPTTVLVENGYQSMTVFRVWWVTTLFPNPVAPGGSSEIERAIPGDDFAYALLAPGWSVDSGAPPSRLIAVKSAQALTVTAHDPLTIAVSDAQFLGNCAAGSLLGDDDARLIVERIFPGQFAGVTYDPATCTSTPLAADAGAPADAAAFAGGEQTIDAATD